MSADSRRLFLSVSQYLAVGHLSRLRWSAAWATSGEPLIYISTPPANEPPEMQRARHRSPISETADVTT